MSSCHFCKCAIARSYFRVGSVMACPECVARESVAEQKTKWKYFWRGISFGVPAAILSCLIMWGVYEFASLDSSSLFSAGAYLRGTAAVGAGFLIGTAIKVGAKNRSSQALQICALVFTYFAYSMAIVPLMLDKLPSSKLTIPTVLMIILFASISPFLAVLKSPLAITGLITLLVAFRFAWAATAGSPEVAVDGPFDSADPYSEKPLFRGLGG
jgi:hypothetical protein